MLLTTQTDYLGRTFGNEAAIRMLAAAGFDAFDLSMFDTDLDVILRGDHVAYAKRLRAVADECGIVCTQAHAPFPSSSNAKLTARMLGADGEVAADDAVVFDAIVRSMEVAAIVGAKCIVVHPRQHLTYADDGAPEELYRINLEFYRALVPYAEKFGIKVACENMWQWKDGHIVHSTCASPAEFCRYIDDIGSEWVTACLDIGHVLLVGESLGGMIRALGRERLGALHIHDNDLKSDSHVLPYTLKIDFDEMLTALAEIDYAGEFTFEADNFFLRFPVEMAQDCANFMCKVGRTMMHRMGK